MTVTRSDSLRSTTDLSQEQIPSSTLTLPSGRTVYIKLIWREVQIDEVQLQAENIGTAVLAEVNSNYQGTHASSEKLTQLAEDRKIKVNSSLQILRSKDATDVQHFSNVLKMAHGMDTQKNIGIWGDTYDATFLAMCFWLFEKHDFQTVEEALQAIEKNGLGLAELEDREKEQLKGFLQAYLNHLKRDFQAPHSQGKVSKMWGGFKRRCCCCCAACFPSRIEPPGKKEYQRLPGE